LDGNVGRERQRPESPDQTDVGAITVRRHQSESKIHSSWQIRQRGGDGDILGRAAKRLGCGRIGKDAVGRPLEPVARKSRWRSLCHSRWRSRFVDDCGNPVVAVGRPSVIKDSSGARATRQSHLEWHSERQRLFRVPTGSSGRQQHLFQFYRIPIVWRLGRDITVSAALTDLPAGVNFRFRLVATNSLWHQHRSDPDFPDAAVPAPNIAVQPITTLRANSAVLNATVNPNNSQGNRLV